MAKAFEYSFVRIFILKKTPIHKSGVAENHRVRVPVMVGFFSCNNLWYHLTTFMEKYNLTNLMENIPALG